MDAKKIIDDAIAAATLTKWKDGRGGKRDAILIPHPPGEGGCWGDYDAADLQAIEVGALARLAPGRKVVDGDGDEDGDILILADNEAAQDEEDDEIECSA